MAPKKTPEVGMGATIMYLSDRKACTIIAHTPKSITVQMDKATRTDSNGLSESQDYTFERNPQGAIKKFTLRENGRWIQTGSKSREWYAPTLVVGYRDQYFDFTK